MVVLEITKEELEGKKVNFIDVRTKRERELGHINGDIHVPITELEIKKNDLDKKKEYVLYCQKGNRSLYGSLYLVAKGYKVKSLKGGYVSYSN